ncbi:testis-specific serine kinase substrate isoform X3 [Dermochelys coriacea]|uniref:testis-specific serine kinase substrate isoform X3 n=1 Tax=Dermochelys coriacea TaxID=27794 RepID=UPI0018E84181|nr:testis-specific serine kinase substrate isoform X3 [Dermochelys coriacea]
MSRGTCEVTGSSQEESQRELFARGASTEFQPLALANLPGTNSLPLARGPGPRQWSPWGPGPVRTMANVVVKTIWQSKEINEAGDPPSGAETRAQSTRDLLGKASPKAFPRKKKAVSFHGVEPPPASEAPPGRLNLKRSSACTNVSLLNLTGDDSESMDDGSGQGASPLSPPLPSRDPAWSEDDTDPSTPLDMVNSGLVRTKDSVTSLKERASRVNRRVQSLQSECSMLCDNLERRRREAEDLEKYCTQLQESCRKVSRSVEDAEIKTNVLKKSSVLLEEKLQTLQQQAQGGELGGQEPEQRAVTEISKHSQDPAGGSPTDPIGSPQGVQGREPGSALEESRQGAMLRTIEQLGVQWQRGHQELQGWLDEAFNMANCTAQALSQLHADLEGLRQVKPLLEDVARQLGSLRALELPDRPPTSCASQGCISAQSLGQMVECAATPLLEELRQCGLPAPCPACQRLQNKILELEQAALETHARAETLSSNLRLAQDEALRAKTYVERVRLSPQEKPPGLDPLHARLSSLQAQLSQDGGPQTPAPPPPQQR